jgi:NTE family protein
VATNYSQAREEVLTRGDLQRCVRASTAIPGALPPVVLQGDLLCDGGSFNNFPVDVMRARRGIGLVIGADLSARKARKISFDDVPSSWTLLRDRLRPRAQRLFKLPSLSAYLLNVTILYSQSRPRPVTSISTRRWSAWACCNGTASTARSSKAMNMRKLFLPALRCNIEFNKF